MWRILLMFCVVPFGTLQVSGQKVSFSVQKSIYENILIYYYPGPTFNDTVIFKLEDGLSLTSQKGFDIKSHSIFYFHGWGESAIRGSTEIIVSAFLDAKIKNVIALDYSQLTRNSNFLSYVPSVLNVTAIGKAVGQFLKQYTRHKQSEDLIKCVSHSLGSQVMAEAAREYGFGQLPHITGLDPAGPLFNLLGVDHLNPKDAKFVDVIHTDAGGFGDKRNIGTADFFPNRGKRVQPGCDDYITDPFTFCSHHRSYFFYAESIRRPEAFLAKKCPRLPIGHWFCDDNALASMGYYVNTSIHGSYWLKTGSESPFGLGVNGI